jgi:putative N-acetyltransferase (TIGR04045 family)
VTATASPSSRPLSAPPARVVCRAATNSDEVAAHLALRRQVFVVEQELFEGDDADERDVDPRTVHAVGLVDGELCGAVRLYPLDEAGLEWKGDRLAVARDRRTMHLGAELVRFAVRTGGDRGGRRMVAHIQLVNIAFFEQLGWSMHGGPAPFHGIEHQLMTIPLSGS